jgi:hypothetical protein
MTYPLFTKLHSLRRVLLDGLLVPVDDYPTPASRHSLQSLVGCAPCAGEQHEQRSGAGDKVWLHGGAGGGAGSLRSSGGHVGARRADDGCQEGILEPWEDMVQWAGMQQYGRRWVGAAGVGCLCTTCASWQDCDWYHSYLLSCVGCLLGCRAGRKCWDTNFAVQWLRPAILQLLLKATCVARWPSRWSALATIVPWQSCWAVSTRDTARQLMRAMQGSQSQHPWNQELYEVMQITCVMARLPTTSKTQSQHCAAL